MSCYLFDNCPRAHKSWTLAVFAISLGDARDYIRVNHPGAHYAGEIESGQVNASCGAVTEKQVIANQSQNQPSR
jgi:hypothetical protein